MAEKDVQLTFVPTSTIIPSFDTENLEISFDLANPNPPELVTDALRTTSFTSVAGYEHKIDSNSNLTVTFPASPVDGVRFRVIGVGGGAGLVTFDPNGRAVAMGLSVLALPYTMQIEGLCVEYQYHATAPSGNDRWHQRNSDVLSWFAEDGAPLSNALLVSNQDGYVTPIQMGENTIVARGTAGIVAAEPLHQHPSNFGTGSYTLPLQNRNYCVGDTTFTAPALPYDFTGLDQLFTVKALLGDRVITINCPSGVQIEDPFTGDVNSTVELAARKGSVYAWVARDDGEGGVILYVTGQSLPTVTVVPPRVLTPISSDQTLAPNSLNIVDVSGGPINLTLPTAASALGQGDIVVKLDGVATNTVTIDGDGSELIDGLATLVLTTNAEWAVLATDGTRWIQIG